MNKRTAVREGFATVMQQLSAEAKKTNPIGSGPMVGVTPPVDAFAAIDARVQELEQNLSKKIDEIANNLEELKTTADEIKEEPPARVQTKTLNTLRKALDKASDAADELEEQKK